MFKRFQEITEQSIDLSSAILQPQWFICFKVIR